MVRVKKSDIGRLCTIKWKDARTSLCIELKDFKNKGYEINHTAGWIQDIFDGNLIFATETSTLVTDRDLTWIFIDNIVEIKFYKEDVK